MKMENLEKMGEKADKILKERLEKHNKKVNLLKKACAAGLIKEPEYKYKNYLSYFLDHESPICPECKTELIKEPYSISPYSFPGPYFHCPNCEYEYAH